MTIKHIDDLKPDKLLEFVKTWNSNKKNFDVTEKFDGNYFVVGLEDDKFYIKTKNKKYFDYKDIPKVFYMDVFRKHFVLFSKIPYKAVIQNVLGKEVSEFEIEGELIPSYDHNIIQYDKHAIGNGVYVAFRVLLEGQQISSELQTKLIRKLNSYCSIVLRSNHEIDLNHKFNAKKISKLEKIVLNEVLTKPARTEKEKEAKEKLLTEIRDIAVSFKNELLEKNQQSKFGDDIEGIVIQNNDLVLKLVDKNKFKVAKEENWVSMNAINAEYRKFVSALKANEDINAAFKVWKDNLAALEKSFTENIVLFTIESKIKETRESFLLENRRIEYIEKKIGKISSEKILALLTTKEIDNKLRDDFFDYVNDKLPKKYLKANVKNIANTFNLAIREIEVVGNKEKDVLGDLDLAVSLESISDALHIDKYKFWDSIEEVLIAKGLKYKINKNLQQFHVVMPLLNDKHQQQTTETNEKSFIQVDFFVGNKEWIKDIMSSAPKESRYKALYRNLFLIAIFRNIIYIPKKNKKDVVYKFAMDKNGLKMSERTKTLTSTGKLKLEKIGELYLLNKADQLTKFLFKNIDTWEEINSFEKLYQQFNSENFNFKEIREEAKREFVKSLNTLKKEIPSEIN